jgi:hypothetical protein
MIRTRCKIFNDSHTQEREIIKVWDFIFLKPEELESRSEILVVRSSEQDLSHQIVRSKPRVLDRSSESEPSDIVSSGGRKLKLEIPEARRAEELK